MITIIFYLSAILCGVLIASLYLFNQKKEKAAQEKYNKEKDHYRRMLECNPNNAKSIPKPESSKISQEIEDQIRPKSVILKSCISIMVVASVILGFLTPNLTIYIVPIEILVTVAISAAIVCLPTIISKCRLFEKPLTLGKIYIKPQQLNAIAIYSFLGVFLGALITHYINVYPDIFAIVSIALVVTFCVFIVIFGCGVIIYMFYELIKTWIKWLIK